jgi:poly(3-hydroxybutyrate) depolymerase
MSTAPGDITIGDEVQRQPNPVPFMAAHGTIGTIGPFHAGSEDWKAYAERLELFFVANGIEDADKRRTTLLTVCGPSTYALIRDLLAPAKPTDKTFAELVALVQKHQ